MCFESAQLFRCTRFVFFGIVGSKVGSAAEMSLGGERGAQEGERPVDGPLSLLRRAASSSTVGPPKEKKRRSRLPVKGPLFFLPPPRGSVANGHYLNEEKF